MELRKLFAKISLDRSTRIWYTLLPHIEELEKNCPKNIKKDLYEYINKFTILKKRIKTLRILRNISFLLLYISILYFFLGEFAVLSKIIGTLQTIVGLFGSTFFIILIAIFSKWINIYVSDAQLIANFIVALKIKYVPKSNLPLKETL